MDYNKSLELVLFSEKAEKTLKEMNNWMFGISLGICSLILFKFNDFDMYKYCETLLVYKILVFYSLLTLFVNGFSKYVILGRESKLNIAYGMLSKLLILYRKDESSEEFKNEWDSVMRGWVLEHSRLNYMASLVKLSTVLNMVLVLGIASFIVYLL
tara:strand:+ start:1424 stop:1891 length:468 start_codon:yes stop_codon:yes gene_type:complete